MMDCTFVNDFTGEELAVMFINPPQHNEEIVFGNPDLEFSSEPVPVYVVTNVLHFAWKHRGEDNQCATIEVALKRQL